MSTRPPHEDTIRDVPTIKKINPLAANRVSLSKPPSFCRRWGFRANHRGLGHLKITTPFLT